MTLSEAEKQKILTLKDLDSEDEAAKEEVEKAKRAALEAEGVKVDDDEAAGGEEEEAEEEEEEDGEGDDGDEEGAKKEKKTSKAKVKKAAQKKKGELKKTASKPLIVKEEEEEEKLLERLEKIEDPTFAPGRKAKVAHRGTRVQSAKRSAARVLGSFSPVFLLLALELIILPPLSRPLQRIGSAARSAAGGSRKRTGKRKIMSDDDADDEEPTQRPTKRARTSKAAPKRRRGKRVGQLDKSVRKITSDPTFDEPSGELNNKCCTLCSSREAIRAVLSNDMALLKKVFWPQRLLLLRAS